MKLAVAGQHLQDQMLLWGQVGHGWIRLSIFSVSQQLQNLNRHLFQDILSTLDYLGLLLDQIVGPIASGIRNIAGNHPYLAILFQC